MQFLTSILQAAEKHGLFPEVQPGRVMHQDIREPPQVTPSGALCCLQALTFRDVHPAAAALAAKQQQMQRCHA